MTVHGRATRSRHARADADAASTAARGLASAGTSGSAERARLAQRRRGRDQMKVYDFVGAPNPKKLRVYLAEKGLSLPMEQVNIVSGDNRKPEFLQKNPSAGLPVLELDDGTHLPESP